MESFLIEVPGLPFQLEVPDNDPKCGALHSLIKHWHSFEDLREMLTEESKTMLDELNNSYVEIENCFKTLKEAGDEEQKNDILMRITEMTMCFEQKVAKYKNTLNLLTNQLVKSMRNILTNPNKKVFLCGRNCHGDKMALICNTDNGRYLKLIVPYFSLPDRSRFRKRRVVTAFVVRPKSIRFCFPSIWFNYKTCKREHISKEDEFKDGNVYMDTVQTFMETDLCSAVQCLCNMFQDDSD